MLLVGRERHGEAEVAAYIGMLNFNLTRSTSRARVHRISHPRDAHGVLIDLIHTAHSHSHTQLTF